MRDPALTRALSLTTEDLRFTEYLSQYITSKFASKLNSSEASRKFIMIYIILFDVTVALIKVIVLCLAWEGSDDWIRLQFKNYLVSLMGTVQRTGTIK